MAAEEDEEELHGRDDEEEEEEDEEDENEDLRVCLFFLPMVVSVLRAPLSLALFLDRVFFGSGMGNPAYTQYTRSARAAGTRSRGLDTRAAFTPLLSRSRCTLVLRRTSELLGALGATATSCSRVLGSLALSKA